MIIKTAWGGKSVNTDFRPPSAGPYQVPRCGSCSSSKDQGKDVEQISRGQSESRVGQVLPPHDRAREGTSSADLKRVYPGFNAKDGYELAGFVWFQGWNDMVDGQTYPERGKPGSYDAYSDALVHFIRDVRKDLAVPELPFVIGVMGAGGPIAKYPPEKQRYAGIHGEFRKAMAAPAGMPEFNGNVTAVLTENYWDMELEELRARDRKLQQELKTLVDKGELEKSDRNDWLEKARSAKFDDRERRILTDGASNQEYHYLGSAKILGQIGKAFAEALHGMPLDE